MELDGKKVLVFGTGISGIAAVNLLRSVGAEVILFDGNKDLNRERVMENFPDQTGITLYVGELPQEVENTLDLAVLSPGVPLDIPVVEQFRAHNIPIWGEIELAYRCGKGDVLAITGTNGKTTTTALLGEIMKHAYSDVKVVGNIGIPYTSVAAFTTDETVTVAEISSFQLETIEEFHPKVSAVLNITPDHLNRHHTMDCYIATKMSIAKNQGPKDTCVLNYEDETLRKEAEKISAKVVYFSSLTKLNEGLYLDGDTIYYADGQNVEAVIQTNELNILGRHNYENVMAATAMALSYGVPMEKIRDVLRSFQAVEHRIEYVTEKRGVRFYNDSKGTNPDAAIKGIQAMDRPTCLIGGGYDKQSEYSEWIQSFDGKVKKLVLIGQTREKIAKEAQQCGFNDYVFADSLQEAVDICYENATNGDAVLLSPACASWGMFPNYEVRGKMFKEIVHALKE
jgi:UDP-N-acetylmuramoylalanine--D-glutamate ligase